MGRITTACHHKTMLSNNPVHHDNMTLGHANNLQITESFDSPNRHSSILFA